MSDIVVGREIPPSEEELQKQASTGLCRKCGGKMRLAGENKDGSRRQFRCTRCYHGNLVIGANVGEVYSDCGIIQVGTQW